MIPMLFAATIVFVIAFIAASWLQMWNLDDVGHQ